MWFCFGKLSIGPGSYFHAREGLHVVQCSLKMIPSRIQIGDPDFLGVGGWVGDFSVISECAVRKLFISPG